MQHRDRRGRHSSCSTREKALAAFLDLAPGLPLGETKASPGRISIPTISKGLALALKRWAEQRADALIGPEGTDKITEGLNIAYGPDSSSAWHITGLSLYASGWRSGVSTPALSMIAMA